MAFTSKTQLGLIYEAQTEDYPDGLAHLVIDQLLKKHKPQDMISRVELCRRLNKIKMNPKKDPEHIFWNKFKQSKHL